MPLDLAQLANDGEVLARVDDVEYRLLWLVVRRAGGTVAPYCLHEQWEASAAARAADLRGRLEPLRTQLAELEAQLAELPPESADDLALQLAELEDEPQPGNDRAVGAAPIRERPPRQAEAIGASGLECEKCGIVLSNPRQLGLHLWNIHRVHGRSRGSASRVRTRQTAP